MPYKDPARKAAYDREWRKIHPSPKRKRPGYSGHYFRNVTKVRMATDLTFKLRRLLSVIRTRCSCNPKGRDWKYYGSKNLEVTLTIEELKILWERDNAASLKQPSIDRIDSDLGYTFTNCQFIEQIENMRKALRLSRTKRSRHGERINTAKLSAAQVKEIIALRGTRPPRGIADQYGVSLSQIYRIFENKTWKHIERNDSNVEATT